MRLLALYAPSLVLLVWAAFIALLGRSDALTIAGLTVTALAVWFHGRRTEKNGRP